MATLYFTSNADSGDGTLRDVMTNAADGDVISPDPVAFAGLDAITISLSSGLPLANVSIVGTPAQRIILDRQGSGYFFRVTSSGYTMAFECVDFINGYRTTSSESPFQINSARFTGSFTNCRFINNTGAYSGFLRGVTAATGATLTFANCVAWGNTHTNSNYSASVFTYQSGAAPDITLTGCTFDTDGELPFTNPGSYTRTGCLFNGENDWQIDFDTVGFVDRANNDYRLAPGSAYLTGGATTGTDILGHARTGSVGAYDGSWLVAAAGASVSVASAQTVDWLDVAATGSLTLAAQVVLTVQRGVTVTTGSAISAATGRAYLVAPALDAAAAATLSNVVVCVSGAGASNFAATTAGMTWAATDSSKPVLLELVSSGVYTTIAQTAGTSYTTTLASGATVRLFDGVTFLSATVPAPPGPSGDFDFHAWGVYGATITVSVGVPYLTTTQTASAYTVTQDFILMSDYYNAGESPVLMARIQDSRTADIITPASVSSITYTAYSASSGWGVQTRTPVDGHEGVTVPATALKAALVTDDPRWTVDSTGYNFIFEPDCTQAPIFPTAGEYVVVVTINFTNANPLPVVFNVSVN